MNNKTKKTILIALSITAAIAALVILAFNSDAEWAGADETVVEKFAEEAGRPPRDPLINTDKGDLLLFVFLLAGAIGGFVMGYYFRDLFKADQKCQEGQE